MATKKKSKKYKTATNVNRDVLLKEMEALEQNITSVYCLTCNQHTNHLSQGIFYSTKDKAMKALKEKANGMRHNMGVTVIKDEADVFSFILGWEEHKVTWQVVAVTIY